MDLQIANQKAMEMVRNASHEKGFLASSLSRDNYKRIWTRDGMITGIAALSTREVDLIDTFLQTLLTIGRHISPQGHVPSNVDINERGVSYGGLAGRADTGSWWLIGLSLYAKYTGDKMMLYQFESNVSKIHDLYQAWEYNNKNLLYVPLAGDWADEYILHGYVLYDQVLRYAALRLTGQLLQRQDWLDKSEEIKKAIHENYQIHQDWLHLGIHPKAKQRIFEKKGNKSYLLASFHPAGYQDYFDALGNSLAMIFKVHPDPDTCIDWAAKNLGKIVPAFHPTIQETDMDFSLLSQNFRFEFRNKPFEFHNGGIWPMVNGFWGLALFISKGKTQAEEVLNDVIDLNSRNNWDFNECFHGKTKAPCGVSNCTWSAAGQLLLDNALIKGFYLLD
ncbi:fructofuranosidase/invertase [Cyclobacteriaceae bacterium YHN15]|jgi:GH15 family glucan-1,4-alpha-glucosidase|nr:fructofuranosidase/invertase [Cyclobacteriaceae bacterium YHN15]